MIYIWIRGEKKRKKSKKVKPVEKRRKNKTNKDKTRREKGIERKDDNKGHSVLYVLVVPTVPFIDPKPIVPVGTVATAEYMDVKV